MTNDTKSRGSRKVAVLGPIPRDQVVTHTGERFEKYGLSPAAHVAAYGLAENTLAVTNFGRRSVKVDRKALHGRSVVLAAPDTPVDEQLIVEYYSR